MTSRWVIMIRTATLLERYLCDEHFAIFTKFYPELEQSPPEIPAPFGIQLDIPPGQFRPLTMREVAQLKHFSPKKKRPNSHLGRSYVSVK